MEVSLEDGFQDELEGSLDHAIADGRNAENAGLAVALGYLLPPIPQRTIRVCRQFVLKLLEERLHAAVLDGLEGDSVNARSSIVLLGQRVVFVKGFPFAKMVV